MALKDFPNGPPEDYMRDHYRTVKVRLDIEHGKRFDEILKRWKCTAVDALRRMIDAQFDPSEKRRR